ncbi:hypothetical protein BMETH_31162718242059, partial [methanotrophic bacterial endosymbiont of Bathymodiolus sp.]
IWEEYENAGKWLDDLASNIGVNSHLFWNIAVIPITCAARDILEGSQTLAVCKRPTRELRMGNEQI